MAGEKLQEMVSAGTAVFTPVIFRIFPVSLVEGRWGD